MINPEHAAMKDLDTLLQQKQVRPTAMRLLVLDYPAQTSCRYKFK